MAISQLLLATGQPRLLAAVRRRARADTIGRLITGSGVWDLMRARGIESTGHNVVVYWDEPGKDLLRSPEGIEVDIGAEILAPFESDQELISTSTPAGRFISAIHTGPYDRLGEAYDTIHSHCRAEGLPLAGPYWEFYGHWNDDPSQLETTVYCLLA